MVNFHSARLRVAGQANTIEVDPEFGVFAEKKAHQKETKHKKEYIENILFTSAYTFVVAHFLFSHVSKKNTYTCIMMVMV